MGFKARVAIRARARRAGPARRFVCSLCTRCFAAPPGRCAMTYLDSDGAGAVNGASRTPHDARNTSNVAGLAERCARPAHS